MERVGLGPALPLFGTLLGIAVIGEQLESGAPERTKERITPF